MERDKYGSQEIDDHHPNSEQEDVHDEKRSIDNRSALDDPAVVVVAQDHPPKKKWPIAFPPFAQCRKPIKSAIAMLIAILMTLSDKCRAAFGQTSLLAAIALVFYSPSRTVGSFMTAQSKKNGQRANHFSSVCLPTHDRRNDRGRWGTEPNLELSSITGFSVVYRMSFWARSQR